MLEILKSFDESVSDGGRKVAQTQQLYWYHKVMFLPTVPTYVIITTLLFSTDPSEWIFKSFLSLKRRGTWNKLDSLQSFFRRTQIAQINSGSVLLRTSSAQDQFRVISRRLRNDWKIKKDFNAFKWSAKIKLEGFSEVDENLKRQSIKGREFLGHIKVNRTEEFCFSPHSKETSCCEFFVACSSVFLVM